MEQRTPGQAWPDHAGHEIMYSEYARTDYRLNSVDEFGAAADLGKCLGEDVSHSEFFCHDCGVVLPEPDVDFSDEPTTTHKLTTELQPGDIIDDGLGYTDTVTAVTLPTTPRVVVALVEATRTFTDDRPNGPAAVHFWAGLKAVHEVQVQS